MKRPAFQFYPADWRKDMALQSCSVAARGLWIDILCIAHECDPYGHLTVNGKPMTAAQIGRHTGLTERECAKLIEELGDAGVLSRTEDGAIYSRRMVRDEDLRRRRAEGGKAGSEYGHLGAEHGHKGGRPPLARGDMKPPLDPPPSSSSSSSEDISVAKATSSAEPTEGPATAEGKTPNCPTEDLMALYNEVLPELPRAKLKTKDRQTAAVKVWKWVLTSKKPDGSRRAETAEQAIEWFRLYFSQVRDNDFLMGRTPRSEAHKGWTCDFDFLLTDRGMKQVVEKTYRDEVTA